MLEIKTRYSPSELLRALVVQPRTERQLTDARDDSLEGCYMIEAKMVNSN